MPFDLSGISLDLKPAKSNEPALDYGSLGPDSTQQPPLDVNDPLARKLELAADFTFQASPLPWRFSSAAPAR